MCNGMMGAWRADSRTMVIRNRINGTMARHDNDHSMKGAHAQHTRNAHAVVC